MVYSKFIIYALQADLNGDGKPEIITATPNGALVIIEGRRAGNGFAKATEIAQVDLATLIADTNEPGSLHALALQAGTLTAFAKELVWSPRKQGIVVVTADLNVLRLDHNLKLAWKQDLKEHFPAGGIAREVAIHISEHGVDRGDQGIVVVGASITPPTLADMEEEEG